MADATERGNALLERLIGEMEASSAKLDLLVQALAVQSIAEIDVPANALYDEQTDEVLRRVLGPADNCVDVGANEGVILARMVQIAPLGQHHAFEPIPSMAAELRARFPAVEVHEVALAAEPGESSFHHVVSNPSYSGLRERRYDRDGEQFELITVRTARLDDELPPDGDVKVLKIDVEGGEEGVLRGGLETIERCRPFVVFEHGLGAADHYGTTPETIHSLLTGCGLEVGLLERWLKGRDALSAAEFADEFSSGRNFYFLAYPPA